MTIYKAYVRPHLNYNEANYDEAYNETFIQKLESIQHNACLALLGGIRGFSREKLYQKLGWNPSNIDVETGNFAYFVKC